MWQVQPVKHCSLYHHLKHLVFTKLVLNNSYMFIRDKKRMLPHRQKTKQKKKKDDLHDHRRNRYFRKYLQDPFGCSMREFLKILTNISSCSPRNWSISKQAALLSFTFYAKKNHDRQNSHKNSVSQVLNQLSWISVQHLKWNIVLTDAAISELQDSPLPHGLLLIKQIKPKKTLSLLWEITAPPIH